MPNPLDSTKNLTARRGFAICRLNKRLDIVHGIDVHFFMTITIKYDWNPEKNEWLKKDRNISFEQIIFHLAQGDVWKIADHPNQKDYPGQKIYFVIVENYIYLVPYIEQEGIIFLKTIIPNRKAARDYQKEIEDKNETE